MKDLPLSYNVDDEDEIENLIGSPSQNNIKEREQGTDNATIDDWSDYTPAKLQQPPSTPLRCLKRKSDSESKNNSNKERTCKSQSKDFSIKTKLGTWAKTKVELAELQKDTFLQEHSTKLRNVEKKHDKSIFFTEQEYINFMKEQHEKRVQLLELGFQEKITLMRTEHEAKMKLINLQKKNYLKKNNYSGK
jgi:hypothetical protein